MTDTTTLITNLRTVLELTSTEIQIAEFRTSQHAPMRCCRS